MKKKMFYIFHRYTPIYTIVKFIIKKLNLKSYHFKNANFMSIVVQNLRCLIWVESFSYVICLACVILVVIAEVVVVFYIQILFWITGLLSIAPWKKEFLDGEDSSLFKCWTAHSSYGAFLDKWNYLECL